MRAPSRPPEPQYATKGQSFGLASVTRLGLNPTSVMFPCPCSLRSTQCAALIALAATAGIARIESAATQPTTRPTSEVGVSVSVSRCDENYFRAAIHVLAPWFRLFESVAITGTSVDDSSSADASRSGPNGGHVLAAHEPAHGHAALRAGAHFSYHDFALPTLSARQHQIPFAIGPPWRGARSNRRVDGTPVPCDSAARGRLVSRVVPVFNSCFVARLARPVFSGLDSPDLYPDPSPGLRGGPEISPNALSAAACACRKSVA